MDLQKLPVFVVIDKQVVKITKSWVSCNYNRYPQKQKAYFGHLAGGGPEFVIYKEMIDAVPNQKVMELLYGETGSKKELSRKNKRRAS